MADWDADLAELRFHWSGAYIISCAGLGRWTAERRDTRETLRSDTPLGLRDLIIADYTARPVSRAVAPGTDRPQAPGCRFLPEG